MRQKWQQLFLHAPTVAAAVSSCANSGSSCFFMRQKWQQLFLHAPKVAAAVSSCAKKWQQLFLHAPKVAAAVPSCAKINKWKDEHNEVAETCVSGKNNTILLLGQRIEGAVALNKINGTSTADYK
jgi:hypothetical protein